MRKLLLGLGLLLASVTLTPASAYVSVHVGVPVVSIGLNVPVYPQLVRVSGYPVYYAPRVRANYFFYDGLYWVYRRGNWYTSYWYNGPWSVVEADDVPLYVLRVPVRYYYDRPALFSTWYADAPPHWVEIWGSSWGERHSGWDRWDRSASVVAAPLPVYQRQFSGNRYPRSVDQQAVLQSQNYRYQPRDTVARQIYQARGVQPATASVAPRASQVRQQAIQARMAPQQSRVVGQQTVLRNEARAARQAQARDARVMRAQQFRTAPRAQELRATRQTAPQRELRAMRQASPQMAMRHAPQPRESRAMRQAPPQMAMRQAAPPKEMRFHAEARGGPGPGGGGHGGDHGGKGGGDKGPKHGKG